MKKPSVQELQQRLSGLARTGCLTERVASAKLRADLRLGARTAQGENWYCCSTVACFNVAIGPAPAVVCNGGDQLFPVAHEAVIVVAEISGSSATRRTM